MNIRDQNDSSVVAGHSAALNKTPGSVGKEEQVPRNGSESRGSDWVGKASPQHHVHPK